MKLYKMNPSLYKAIALGATVHLISTIIFNQGINSSICYDITEYLDSINQLENINFQIVNSKVWDSQSRFSKNRSWF